MYSRPALALKYFSYFLGASNGKGHGTHSPFVYEFITRVLNDRTPYPAYREMEAIRRRLLKDPTRLEVEDLGAGSLVSSQSTRRVSSIARHAAKPAKFGQLLFRMVRYYRPAVIVELGTSLGITTGYLALADPGARVISLEGADAVADIAQKNLDSAGVENARIVRGNFDDTLHSVLEQLKELDFCFVDGNHRREPTVRYFQELLPRLSNDGFLVIDDIHWSAEMEEAWSAIRADKRVTCTIDLFFIGIVSIRKEFKAKQDFRIRF